MSAWDRCRVVVPSGLEAPRTYRCWWPTPCPHHDGRVRVVYERVDVAAGELDVRGVTLRAGDSLVVHHGRARVERAP